MEHCVASTGVAGSPNRLPPAGRADSSPAAANRGHYPLASPALVKYAECLRRGGVDILVRGTSVPEFNPQKLSTPTPALAAAERRCANALP
ncbi:MAG TPA: hypothetical protein VKG62_00135 [Solirubrobacteraceae bacterium]|nr:hypothetical protein [Solirubrobacteraceae bacterium]